MGRRVNTDAAVTRNSLPAISLTVEVSQAIDAVQQLWQDQAALSDQSVERMSQKRPQGQPMFVDSK